MIENLAPFVSGAAGVGTGTLAMWLVMRERVGNMIATQQERDARYTARLDKHAKEIGEIKERKHCGPCNDLTMERRKFDAQQQTEQKQDMADLKKEMVAVRETVNSCFEDLVREMRK